jgi:mediator of RNA polymerase II transcription subunit 28
MALMTNQEQCCVAMDAEEMRNSMEHSIQRFLDATRQLDCFFMQKRLLLTSQKPESAAKEDLSDLRVELERKNALLQRHSERLQNWTTMLNRSPSGSSSLGSMGGTSSPGGSGPGSAQPSAAAMPSVVLPSQSTGGIAMHMQQLQPPLISSQPSTPILGISGPGFPTVGSGATSSHGPLAYLEQTTSSIGQMSRGSSVGMGGGAGN